MDIDLLDMVLDRLRIEVPIRQVTVSEKELKDTKKLIVLLQEEALAYYHLKENQTNT